MSALFFRLAAAAVCGALAWPALGAGIRLPEGPGANLVYAKCQTCHDLQYVVDGKGLLPSQWAAVLASMHDYGLQISEAESQQVLQYLTTYLGPKPPPVSTASAAPATTAQPAPDGASVYAQNCASCHGAQGRGQAGNFPPLAGNPDLAAGNQLPLLVVLNGLSGAIQVNGQTYDGSMPAFGHLSDAEIAAVVNHVRTAWGARPSQADAMITAEAVARQRQQPLAPGDVHAFHERMKR